MRRYTCECCGAPTRAGVTCDPCEAARLDALLQSSVWRENAKTRTGDMPGETMLDTIVRERKALGWHNT